MGAVNIFLKISFDKITGTLRAYLLLKNEFLVFAVDKNFPENLLNHLESGSIKIFNLYVDCLENEGLIILQKFKATSGNKIEYLAINLSVFFIKIYYKNIFLKLFCLKKLIPFELGLSDCADMSKNYMKFMVLNGEKNNLTEDLVLLQECDIFTNLILMKYKFSYITDMFKQYNIKHVKEKIYSLSGFSQKCFFNNFNNFNIKDSVAENIETYVRSSFFGGRCEVFGNPVDGDIIHYFDYKGMYSLCMREEFPSDAGCFCFEDFNLDNPGFYDIDYESSNMYIPILPHKNKITNKLMFTNGRMRGVFWHEEILLFLENGGVVHKIYSGYIFKSTAYVFQNFIENFEKLKDIDVKNKNFVKLCINSLFGRFALKKNKLKTTIITNNFDPLSIYKNSSITRSLHLHNCWLIEHEDDIKNNKYNGLHYKEGGANIIYASIITSKARIKLYKTFLKLLGEGCRLLHCNTDSIFAASKGADKPIIENTIYKQYTDAVFFSQKYYMLKHGDKEELISNSMSSKTLDFLGEKKLFFYGVAHDVSKNSNGRDFLLVESAAPIDSYKTLGQKRKFTKNKIGTTPYLFIDDYYI